MITLIDAVRATRKNKHRFFAIDSDLKVYSYYKDAFNKVNKKTGNFTYKSIHIDECKFLGRVSHLNCKWYNTLIDVSKIKVK